MIRRLALLLLPLVVGAALVVSCGDDDQAGSPTAAQREPRVEVILDWFANADHAGLIGAVDKDLFPALSVTTRVPTDAAASLKQVAAGKADFAISYQPEVLLARNQGIPVVAVGSLVGVPLNSVMARADRGIARPRDLEDKTVGAAGVPSDRALLDTIVRADGGDPAKVRLRNVGFNLAPALAAGRVDAVIGAYWNIERPELERKRIDLTVLRLEEHGVPTYDELVVVTSDRTVAEKPDIVRRFLEGLWAGQRWAAQNPEDAVQALIRANPDLEEGLLSEQVAVTAPLFTPRGKRPLEVNPAEWAAFSAWMTENGLLKRDPDRNLLMAVDDGFLPAG